MSIPRTRGTDVNEPKMADHLQLDRYGDFWLTDAIRPAQGLPIVPRQGYRIDTYRDGRANFSVPVLAASISREKLFDVFIDLLDPPALVPDGCRRPVAHATGRRHHPMIGHQPSTGKGSKVSSAGVIGDFRP